MVKIMEKPMNKWMIWGVKTPLFLVQHPYGMSTDRFNDSKSVKKNHDECKVASRLDFLCNQVSLVVTFDGAWSRVGEIGLVVL